MPKITANNYEMHYEVDDFTDPWKSAETIWIQHGFGRSSRFWYHWVPPLARDYRVVRRDMRGHGQSADPGPSYAWSVDDLLSDEGVPRHPRTRSRPLCRRIGRRNSWRCLCRAMARAFPEYDAMRNAYRDSSADSEIIRGRLWELGNGARQTWAGWMGQGIDGTRRRPRRRQPRPYRLDCKRMV